MKVLLLDNYDSFTFNLLHYLEQLTDDITVMRNDQISIDEVESYSHIVISPGPGLPKDAGITNELIRTYYKSKAILGICLGCQAMAEIFGARLYNQNNVAHGIQRKVRRTYRDSWLMKDLPKQIMVGLYHSWAIDPRNLKEDFITVANSENETLMAIEHQSLPLAGVQFHPESIMSESGIELIKNWLEK